MSDTAEVSTHFRIPILSGESTFSIRVPRHHFENNRKFFFSQLNLVPDYFSQDAEDQKLDADPDLELDVDKEMTIKIHYPKHKTVYIPEAFSSTGATPLIKDVIANINIYFESNKPDFALTTPCFIDWIDLVEKAAEKDVLDYVPRMSEIYYGPGRRSSEFTDYLPSSTRMLEHVNNFMPPLGTMISPKAFADRIRLRFWMAPFTKAIFSSKDPFANDFGFMENQMGTYNTQLKQYHLINDTPNWLPMMTGKLAPKLELTRKDFKFAIIPSRIFNEGHIKEIQMKKKDWMDNEKLAETLADRIKRTYAMSNTIFSFVFNADEKKFVF